MWRSGRAEKKDDGKKAGVRVWGGGGGGGGGGNGKPGNEATVVSDWHTRQRDGQAAGTERARKPGPFVRPHKGDPTGSRRKQAPRATASTSTARRWLFCV